MVLTISIKIPLKGSDGLKVSTGVVCCVFGEEFDGPFEVVLRYGLVSEVEVILIYLICLYVSRMQRRLIVLESFAFQVVGEVVYLFGP